MFELEIPVDVRPETDYECDHLKAHADKVFLLGAVVEQQAIDVEQSLKVIQSDDYPAENIPLFNAVSLRIQQVVCNRVRKAIVNIDRASASFPIYSCKTLPRAKGGTKTNTMR
jgi:hypothetical protein